MVPRDVPYQWQFWREGEVRTSKVWNPRSGFDYQKGKTSTVALCLRPLPSSKSKKLLRPYPFSTKKWKPFTFILPSFFLGKLITKLTLDCPLLSTYFLLLVLVLPHLTRSDSLAFDLAALISFWLELQGFLFQWTDWWHQYILITLVPWHSWELISIHNSYKCFFGSVTIIWLRQTWPCI